MHSRTSLDRVFRVPAALLPILTYYVVNFPLPLDVTYPELLTVRFLLEYLKSLDEQELASIGMRNRCALEAYLMLMVAAPSATDLVWTCRSVF